MLDLSSPTPSHSSDGSSGHATDTVSPRSIPATSCDSGIGIGSNSGTPSPTTSPRNYKAHQATTIAAMVESTITHRHLIPGLAELLGGSKDKIINYNLPCIKRETTVGAPARNVHIGDNKTRTTSHSSLPSVDEVSNTANRFIGDFPPFVTMSAKDSAPQIKLEPPPPRFGIEAFVSEENKSMVDVENANDDNSRNKDAVHFLRNLVVKGEMKGYRMSRATHGVSSGCYYYEAIILGTSDDKRGTKRPLQEVESREEDQQQEIKPTKESIAECTKGHLRIGWSTRLASLQAPVGYNQHSYAIRDIMGSRIHNSRRQDKWGGEAFGPGDVLGVSIYVVQDKAPPQLPTEPNATTSTGMPKSTSFDDVDSRKESENSGEKFESMHDNQQPATPLKSHIRFFINGKPMGNNGIGFDDIQPGTYYPAVSCYMEGSAWLNFGPYFVYPPHQSMHLPPEINPQPISDLCHAPPLPEEVVQTVISSGSGGKKGGHINLSKKVVESIVSAFKDLVEIEAAVRRRVHLKHLELHKLEISAMRKERGLSTVDLV